MSLLKLVLIKEDDLTKAIGKLASGAMFFGMISHEYVITTLLDYNNPNTKILSLRNIQFYKGRGELHQKDAHLEREA